MPTYVYRREDGTKFEIEQRITEDPLETCPTTGQKVTRVISGTAGLVFKGSGFYLTDYVRNGNGSSQAATNGNGSAKSESSDSPSTPASSEAKKTTPSSSTG